MVEPSSGWQLVSTSSDAVRELGRVGFTPGRIEPVAAQGWASWTYELDGRFIVRFPRNDDIVEAMHREMRLLPVLARHVSFRVPEPLVVADDWFVYEKIPGRPFRRGDDLDAALAMIGELHTFPVEVAESLVGRPRIEDPFVDALPLLEAGLLDEVQVLLELPAPEVPTFIHDDLGCEHVLVDDDGRPVGIIDWEDATIGDPAVDLMPVLAEVGRPLTERMWRFHCRGTLHALVHAVREGLDHEIEPAITELRRRLALRPGR